jgi:ABC-type transport system involved in multi-copper enzyme maturation permease subunit
MIALLFGLSVAQIIITPIEQITARLAKEGSTINYETTVERIMEIGEPVIEWAIGIKTGKEIVNSKTQQQGFSNVHSPYAKQSGQQVNTTKQPWTVFLLEERPALLSVIFLILLFGMPLLIAFLAFNQVSGDVQSKGLRYLLLRTERANIFIGRFLGTVIFSTIVIAFIIVTITFYLGVKIKIYPVGLLAIWGLHGFVGLAILMIPYIALCSVVSAWVDSPFLSLVLAKLIIGGVLLFAFLGSLAWKPAKYLMYALPWGFQNHLLHPELTHSLGAGLACLGYTLVFFWLGYHHFETRDL